MNYNYYETMVLYPELKIISDNFEIIKNELDDSQNEWKLWKDIVKSNSNDGWKTIPIYGFGKWTSASENFPELKKYTSSINKIKLILF